MTQKRLHAIIHGKVQGVGFRYFLRNQANNLNLSGWTKNKLDRTVEVLVEGNQTDLEEFLLATKKGPPSSNVSQIEHTWEEASGEFNDFKIRRTI